VGDNAALPAGSAYLASAKPEHLQAQLDKLFAFHKVDKDGEAYPTDCPNDLARHVLVNASLLPVMSISRTPVIRADGSVIETPGYDAATGIIYAPDTTFPPVPAKPTKGDAEAALIRLRKPFRDFPFVTEADLDAVIAELLTILVRHLVPIAPAFVHNAVEAVRHRCEGRTLLRRAGCAGGTGKPGKTGYPGPQS
jgi:putative DNA primase/helicase